MERAKVEGERERRDKKRRVKGDTRQKRKKLSRERDEKNGRSHLSAVERFRHNQKAVKARFWP